MNGYTKAVRPLRPEELATVSGGYDSAEFMSSVSAGAAIGAPAGRVLLAGFGVVAGTITGAFVGGFFGAAYYAANELADYCF